MSCKRECLVAPSEMKAIEIPMRAQLSLRRSTDLSLVFQA